MEKPLRSLFVCFMTCLSEELHSFAVCSSRPVCWRSGDSVLAETSVTIQVRDRTLTIFPCSGWGEVVVLVMRHSLSQVSVQRDWPFRLEKEFAASVRQHR